MARSVRRLECPPRRFRSGARPPEGATAIPKAAGTSARYRTAVPRIEAVAELLNGEAQGRRPRHRSPGRRALGAAELRGDRSRRLHHLRAIGAPHAGDFLDHLGQQLLSGLLVGLIVGFTGVGGGSLMAPIMILFLGVAPVTAVGTDLWFAAITKAVGGDGPPSPRQRRPSCREMVVHREHPRCVGHCSWSQPLSMEDKSKGGLVTDLLGAVLLLTATPRFSGPEFVRLEDTFV